MSCRQLRSRTDSAGENEGERDGEETVVVGALCRQPAASNATAPNTVTPFRTLAIMVSPSILVTPYPRLRIRAHQIPPWGAMVRGKGPAQVVRAGPWTTSYWRRGRSGSFGHVKRSLGCRWAQSSLPGPYWQVNGESGVRSRRHAAVDNAVVQPRPEHALLNAPMTVRAAHCSRQSEPYARALYSSVSSRSVTVAALRTRSMGPLPRGPLRPRSMGNHCIEQIFEKVPPAGFEPAHTAPEAASL